jgi:simple sugar transport system ATP-binding protein
MRMSDLARQDGAYDVRPRRPAAQDLEVSGGNQQKIVLAREIERAAQGAPRRQADRGVDIGASSSSTAASRASRRGRRHPARSVELDEIMALSDRILAMCGGKITGECRPEETDERDLGLLMAGVDEAA